MKTSMSVVKNNSTAEIIVLGTAAVVKSGIALEDWKKALNFDPELGLYDDDDKPLFRVSIEEGPGSMNKDRVVFSAIPTKEGVACATIILDPTEEDKEKLVSEHLGLALLRLIEVEENLPKIIKEAEGNEEKVAQRIRSI